LLHKLYENVYPTYLLCNFGVLPNVDGFVEAGEKAPVSKQQILLVLPSNLLLLRCVLLPDLRWWVLHTLWYLDAKYMHALPWHEVCSCLAILNKCLMVTCMDQISSTSGC